MKGNNLLLLSFLLLTSYLFVACSKEELVSYETGVSSFTIKMQDPLTKAAAEGYDWATAEEVKINSCFIGFYSALGEKIVGYNKNNVDLTSTKAGSYTVNNVVVPMNVPLNVYIIANPPANAEYENVKTLSELKSKVVSYTQPSDFITSADNLIKVGGASKTFSSTDNTVNVTLTQLAVKVRVEFDMSSTEVSDVKGFTINGQNAVDIFNALKKVGKEPTKKIAELGLQAFIETCSGNSDAGHGFGTDFGGGSHSSYINEKGETVIFSGSSPGWLVIKCDSVQTKTLSTWSFTKPTVTVNNIQLNSYIELTTGQDGETTDFSSYPIAGDFADKSVLDFTFYTYRKDATETAKKLNVSIEGTLNPETYKSTRSNVGGKIHCVWVNGETGKPEPWGNGNEIRLSGGEGASSGFQGWSDWSDMEEATDDSGRVPVPGQTYQATIDTDKGLEPGHYYHVTGTLKVDPKQNVTVGWEVVDMTGKEVNIPDFK